MITDPYRSPLPKRSARPFVWSTAVLACSLAALTACASLPADEHATSPTTDAKASALLPADIRKSGEIVIATDASYAPIEFFDTDNKTIIGLDPELGSAIGSVLGVQVRFVNTNFDGIIASIQAGRADLAMSAMTDKIDRQEQIDFIDYLSSGTGVMVKAGNPSDIAGFADLCGRSVAVQTGTNAADYADEASAECSSTGKGALEVQRYPNQNGATLALDSGRADAVLGDTPLLAYTVTQTGEKFETVGDQFEAAPYGIGVSKDNAGLRDAVAAALLVLQKNGTYADILEAWNLQDAALEGATINGGTS